MYSKRNRSNGVVDRAFPELIREYLSDLKPEEEVYVRLDSEITFEVVELTEDAIVIDGLGEFDYESGWSRDSKYQIMYPTDKVKRQYKACEQRKDIVEDIEQPYFAMKESGGLSELTAAEIYIACCILHTAVYGKDAGYPTGPYNDAKMAKLFEKADEEDLIVKLPIRDMNFLKAIFDADRV